MSNSVNLLLVGDVMIGRSFNQKFNELKRIYKTDSKYLDYPWGDTLHLLQSSDGVVANLETTITSSEKKWPRKTFNYKLNPEYSKTLQRANIIYCSLANNHILDYMKKGFKQTVKNLKKLGISYSGAGQNLEKAHKPAILKIKEKKFAFFSAADHYNYWDAKKQQPGIWYISLPPTNQTKKEIKQLINKVRKDVDFVIFSLHWGGNYVDDIDDKFTNFGHFLIDNGVDVVHGHSAHHTLPYEEYKNGLIFYSLGDFVDDYAINRKYRNDLGVIVSLEFSDKPRIKKIYPTKIKDFQVNFVKNIKN